MSVIKHLYFFSNGNTACFNEKGQQMPEHQGSWLLLFVTTLALNGVDLEKIEKIILPDGTQAKLFKNQEGGWNWEIK